MRKQHGKTTGRRMSHFKNVPVKWIVGFVMLNGAIWLFMSYVLAYCGIESLRALCITIAAEVIGTAAVYQIKAPLDGPKQHKGKGNAANKRKKDAENKEE